MKNVSLGSGWGNKCCVRFAELICFTDEIEVVVGCAGGNSEIIIMSKEEFLQPTRSCYEWKGSVFFSSSRRHRRHLMHF